MVLMPYALGDALPPISWLFIDQFSNEIYQWKAEYVSYSMILFISQLIKYSIA